MEHAIPPSEFRSRWSDDDQDEVLGFIREKAKVCRCGTRADEWAANRNAYTVEIEKCPGCEQLAIANKHTDDGEHAYLIPTAIAVALQEAREQAND